MAVFRFTTPWNLSKEESASPKRPTAKGTRGDVRFLRGQVDRLQMICEAMWTITKRRLGVGDDELSRLVEEIDLRDGKLDGRSEPARACSECSRVVSSRTRICIYCGAENLPTGVF